MPSKTACQAKDQNPAKIQRKASQPQALSGKFASATAQILETSSNQSDDSTTTSQPSSTAIDFALVENLIDDPDNTYDDKLAKALAFYA